MLFNKGDIYNKISHLTKIDLVGKISINEFNGNKTMNLLVEHIIY